MFHLLTEAQFVTLLVAAPGLIFCAAFAGGRYFARNLIEA
ncbi:hypothetical protein MJC1_01913 [Methylocystis sp. MJC1]|jgi:Tfp pilus assembly protein PilN|nr:hypothetical protein MJC1_01913 [Methylocystis sp. MJC1]